MIFFTSDTHFNHNKVLEYCPDSRGQFRSVEEMNEVLITNWNSKISDNDLVYHLGDVGFGNLDNLVEILSRLNGHKILVPGNHDFRFLDKEKFRRCFDEVTESLVEIKVSGDSLVLCHFPMMVWNRHHYGVRHLHGHCHGTVKYHDLALDCGVDNNLLFPWSYEEIRDYFSE